MVDQMLKNLAACRRPGFHLWGRKIPWRSEWLPTPVFLPGEFHGQMSLAGSSPRGCKESDTCSVAQSCLAAAPRTAAGQASLSFAVSQSWLKFRSIESVMPASYLILCRPLLLLSSIFPSIRVFSNKSALHTESSQTLLSD